MYRLALRLGQPNVDVMLRSMTSRQLKEWLTFMEMEPFGEDRDDIRSGVIVQTLLNIFRDRRFRPRAFKLAECVVPGGDAFDEVALVPTQSWQQMKITAMITAMMFSSLFNKNTEES